jgi:hypothetical protein
MVSNSNAQQMTLFDSPQVEEPIPVFNDVESEYIPATPQQVLEEPSHEMYLNMEPLTQLASGKTVRIPRNPHFSRKDVVNAFHQSFELVGGIPRLALWANDNYTDFAKLYARLLPSQASSSLGEAQHLIIEMAIKPSALDE